MKVTNITATVKYSLDTGHGWKTLEIGAEATIGINDNWQQAQHQLYGELSQQLHRLWSNGTSDQNVSESAVQPSARAEPPEHRCQAHGVPFKQFSKGDSVWYAHKAGNAWCNERK